MIILLIGREKKVVAVEAMKSGVKDYLVERKKLTPDKLMTSFTNVIQPTHWQSPPSKNMQQQQLIAETASRIHQSLDLSQILNTAIREVQLLLNCDRVVIYKFTPDSSGDIVAESVKSPWTKSLSKKIANTCFQKQGKPLFINNIYEAKLAPCQVQLLEKFEVKSQAVVPILLSSSCLWGLLIVDRCSYFRSWETDEIELLDKLSVQFAIAVRQGELSEKLQNEVKNRQKLESKLEQAEKSLKTTAKELEWLNRELVNITCLLKRRNQELENFAYVTSHDLKAPLRAIFNLAVWLKEDLEGRIPPENQQQLQLMQSRVKRMSGLIQGLLEYSRIGRRSSPIKTVNIKDLVNETIDSLSPPPEFEIIVDDSLPTMEVETLSMQQVFANLISNAIKYHHQNRGKIVISALDKGDFYEFAVADDGPGIEPRYHERIFTIFQTLQPKDIIESTGIGLSIVKKIVEDRGGTVRVESQLDRGATFYFTWHKKNKVSLVNE